MEFLNNYTCRIMNSCNLIGMLGGFLACVLCMNQNCRPEQSTSCHCEELCDEAIHKIECNSLHKNPCRPELVSGPIQRRIDTFNVNQFLNKFYKSCRPEQSNPCHCEELCDEAIHKTNYKRSTSCHCEQREANHFKQYDAICHCEELCDEAIHKAIQDPQESRGVKCQ